MNKVHERIDGYKTYAAGNIGLAFSEIALNVSNSEYAAVEVSSFQLDLIDKFKPKIAAILNITPDHLNRYENNYQNYIASKLRIYSNQDKNDFLILNRDNNDLMKSISSHNSRDYYFSLSTKNPFGCSFCNIFKTFLFIIIQNLTPRNYLIKWIGLS